MIFISYSSVDKPIIEPVAETLAKVFGRDNIFYDSWSIQPGDGIIDKMNRGLRDADYFLFFVTKQSLTSNMVKLEWQNAIYKATQGKCRIIPVKVDDCIMPPVLAQTLYVDVFGQGLQNGVRQIIDVIKGQSTYQPSAQRYHNVRAYVSSDGPSRIFEFRAETYMEPQSRYLILLENTQTDISDCSCLSDPMFTQSSVKEIKLNNGQTVNALAVSIARPTSPGFPFTVRISPRSGAALSIIGVMRAIAVDKYERIPMIEEANRRTA